MHKIDPVVWLLTALVVFFTITVFLAEWWFRSDAVFFQAIIGAMASFSGALMLKITGKTPDAPPGTTVSTTSTTQEVPPGTTVSTVSTAQPVPPPLPVVPVAPLPVEPGTSTIPVPDVLTQNPTAISDLAVNPAAAPAEKGISPQ